MYCISLIMVRVIYFVKYAQQYETVNQTPRREAANVYRKLKTTMDWEHEVMLRGNALACFTISLYFPEA
jgi:hypothetical protein